MRFNWWLYNVLLGIFILWLFFMWGALSTVPTENYYPLGMFMMGITLYFYKAIGWFPDAINWKPRKKLPFLK